ncbi:MAG TPA: ligase-associated DNA damage response endonuclease PdeM [Chitinophagaceae bacterium]
MKAPQLHKLNSQTLWLSAERSLFWEEQKALVLSDLHLGKTGHFRKAGIAVPQAVLREDMQRLMTLLHYFRPEQLIVVGDFFHSRANLELELFKRWRYDVADLPIRLVRGNHDILQAEWYQEAAIDVIEPDLLLEPFLFTHDRCVKSEAPYTFCGHIHPGIVIQGLGRQSLRFPCFYFTPQYCILPAFGKFTGLATVQPSAGDTMYAIVEQTLMRIQ